MFVLVLQATREPTLPPRLVHHHRNRVGQIQAAIVGPHRQAQALAFGPALAHCIGQAAGFGPKQQAVAGRKARVVITAAATGG